MPRIPLPLQRRPRFPRAAMVLLGTAWVVGALAFASAWGNGTEGPDLAHGSMLSAQGLPTTERATSTAAPTEQPRSILRIVDRTEAVPSETPSATEESDEDAGEGAVAEEDAAESREAPETDERFVMPVEDWSHVTDRFGAHRGPGMTHGGIDLAMRGLHASPVFSSCNGTVSTSAYSSTYGNYAVVNCGEGWSTLYAHFSETYVSTGQAVKTTTVLGRTGNSGFSTGEHLHFEIIYNGTRVNPEHYLDFNIPAGTPLSSGPIFVPDWPWC